MTRSSVLEVLREDYVRTARAKGVAERLVVSKHALRNAAIPILTLLGLQAGQLMGGAVLTETVFAWPGLGRLMVKAIFARDYVLVQGAVLVFALAFVSINLAVDLAYGALDPRIVAAGLGDGHLRGGRAGGLGGRRRRAGAAERLGPVPAQSPRGGGPGHRGPAPRRGPGRAVARALRSRQAEPDREAGEAGREVPPRRRRVRARHPLARDLRQPGRAAGERAVGGGGARARPHPRLPGRLPRRLDRRAGHARHRGAAGLSVSPPRHRGGLRARPRRVQHHPRGGHLGRAHRDPGGARRGAGGARDAST